ncbi:MAG: UDP-N-acetylmuramoyl-tripeptide--D-alanyl-D-alanine ligase [Chitinophagaceae bacterium]|uniref:UDP-N-acetylmuramoyl-tripeptide--D-alanyl-D- alanine ligase n=1 Tax=unclassified Paraflavitalea TaxID=2798305 RepID=UPI003D344AEB|nr:UDP-N-acetylmuramoyl-tripeptide--D-alanyl-D-alanine ligase [Chitinophagaceae bacterium]
MTIASLYQIFLQYPNITTDTRKLEKDTLFFALKGPSFNGNNFAKAALEAGAAYAIIDEKEFYVNERTILVEDVLSTLQQLAKHHREQFTIPFIAITGSNGKTTTKELIHTVLSGKYKTYTTEGNLNNHIGIPLTILKVRKDAEIAVIEMGANHQKEIQGYCTYTLPTHAVITNCGKAHLEGFGGVEGVRKGKGELYDFIRANNGTAFVMWDYDYLQTMSKGIREVITYGTANAQLNGHLIQSDPFLEVGIDGETPFSIQTHLVGSYNLPNVLVAVSIGKYFKVADEVIKNQIEQYIPSNSRSQLVKRGSNSFILDAYNANPSSMKLAIENFAGLPGDKKVLLLGSMAELGEESAAEHDAIIALIGKYKWEEVVLVGPGFQTAKHAYKKFANSEEAAQWFNNESFENTQFLVKGSRSTKMEKVIGA